NVFLASLTDLPFGQTLAELPSESSGSMDKLEVHTDVQPLEYWQKPDVKASYDGDTDTLNLSFGIPTPEQYDYTVSHGTVDIPMPSGIRVNARYYSDEIPHGLGMGAVDVRLSLEFEDSGSPALMVGNSEVFKSRNIRTNPPWAEAAAIVYPDRGTMRIGVWLHDNVDGDTIRVHYFAQKPERDTGSLVIQRKIGISILPEVARLSRREQLKFKATVTGSDDKSVIWSVKESDGGVIDANGIYQAPEMQGTYEIVASAGADPRISVSAFVIVE
ncbi:MAG: hypothetical protein IJG63_04105, partial [Oscillospiraceae bacterium]|nr:hypothetical protein [Oscillospiraceae bacterium]